MQTITKASKNSVSIKSLAKDIFNNDGQFRVQKNDEKEMKRGEKMYIYIYPNGSAEYILERDNSERVCREKRPIQFERIIGIYVSTHVSGKNSDC